jgi:hypothetical protein
MSLLPGVRGAVAVGDVFATGGAVAMDAVFAVGGVGGVGGVVVQPTSRV